MGEQRPDGAKAAAVARAGLNQEADQQRAQRTRGADHSPATARVLSPAQFRMPAAAGAAPAARQLPPHPGRSRQDGRDTGAEGAGPSGKRGSAARSCLGPLCAEHRLQWAGTKESGGQPQDTSSLWAPADTPSSSSPEMVPEPSGFRVLP